MKRSGIAVKTPFENYIKLKEQFLKEHPKATIVEEIKTLSFESIKIPHPTFGNTMQAHPTIMIIWAVIFDEDVTAVEPDKKLIIVPTDQDK